MSDIIWTSDGPTMGQLLQDTGINFPMTKQQKIVFDALEDEDLYNVPVEGAEPLLQISGIGILLSELNHTTKGIIRILLAVAFLEFNRGEKISVEMTYENCKVKIYFYDK